QTGYVAVEQRAYQVVSTPIDQGDENIGVLSVGERFDFSDFSTPIVLAHKGSVLRSNIPGASPEEVEAALKACAENQEWKSKLHGEAYISQPIESNSFGGGYVLRSLQSVDSASAPVQAILRNVFWIAGIVALLAAMSLSALSSRSIV